MKFFGTDGIRGKYGESLINDKFFFIIGYSMGNVLSDGDCVLIGHDGRESAYNLQDALAKGFEYSKKNIIIESTGLITTPCLSFTMKKSGKYKFGLMISASHNAYYDNGIKILHSNGEKINYDIQSQIEKIISEQIDKFDNLNLSTLQNNLRPVTVSIDDYRNYGISFLKNEYDKKVSIAIDCANGGSSFIVNQFKNYTSNTISNIDFHIINNAPNGMNINKDCGSTKINNVLNYIIENNVDLGIAFDGDGDRVIMCLKNGFIVDGDQIICILNRELNIKKNKQYNIVGTIMSNYGLESLQNKNKSKLIRTDVGDIHVKNAMNEHRINIGGEQSGHIICKPYFDNGDGFLCSMLLLGLYLESNMNMNEFFFGFEPVKQYLFAVKYDPSLYNTNQLCDILYQKYSIYGKDGRVNVRKSGTESVIRVMIESNTVVLDNVINEINNEKYY